MDNFNEFMKNFIDEAYAKKTENGARAYSSTGNDLLDLFSTIGALRSRSKEEIIEKYERAYDEDSETALRMLFYCGDIRGGLGERRTFCTILNWLGNEHPSDVISNLHNIPFFNRYDSLFALIGTRAEEDMWKFIKTTLCEDLRLAKKGKSCSLLAKWMPSINTSSKETRWLAEECWRKNGNKNEKAYRTMLSYLRKHIDVVERKMSSGEWDKIVYEDVPSNAMLNYKGAFEKHDEERFKEYLNDVAEGKKEIKSAVLYPYNLVHEYTEGVARVIAKLTETEEKAIEAMWQALPNYVEEGQNVLVMADVSGSMLGRPMDTSIGLAAYFAQHNTGLFRNCFMTFSSKPQCIRLRENCSLKTAIKDICSRNLIGYSTDLDKAFGMVYALSVKNKIKPEDMPKALVVISDMEIDPYFAKNVRYDFVTKWEKKFEEAGYKMPKLVLWNVESRQDTFLTRSENVILVSGQSASTFTSLVNCATKTATQIMMDTLYGTDRYDRVIVLS